MRREHTERASYVFDRKADALRKAQSIASNQESVLVIHRQDGTIERQQDFTNN
ncbi:MAG: DUF2188 domain-containing protein [Bacillus sp. (in: Bacteria)]|nr:DUF2188 domain-containing protein [Bacillus sp. (in: firmicutes)]